MITPLITNNPKFEDQPEFVRHYASGQPFFKLNMELIKRISDYALNQIDPQVTKEAVDVINYITTAATGEGILRYAISKDINTELQEFLIKTITNQYN